MTPEADSELEGLCARQGLHVMERLEVPGGASQFLARVRDHDGRNRFLKRSTGLRGRGEIPALLAFAASGHVPGDIEVVDDLTFLCEWIDGVTLERSTRDRAGLLQQCGRVLRAMHRPPGTAFAFMPIRERAAPDWFDRDMGTRLPSRMLEPARSAGQALRSYRDDDAVLLHGDCVPGNVVVAGERLVFVDPIGFSGPAAWDLAQMAVAVPGRDRRQNLRDLLSGYGRTPPLTGPAFDYMAFMFLAKNIELEEQSPGSRAGYLAELGELCETSIGARGN